MTTSSDSGKLLCGAFARSAGRPCRKPAGWGTDHPGSGKCRLHGGAGSGPPKGNSNSRKHGLSAERCKVTELRRELESRLAAAEAERDPLAPHDLAEDLQSDIRRLLARALMVEQRIDDLIAAGKFNRDAQAAADLFVVRLENTVARLRAVQAGLVARFPSPPAVDDSERGALLLGRAGEPPIQIHPGASVEDVRSVIGLESDLPPAPVEREPGDANLETKR